MTSNMVRLISSARMPISISSAAAIKELVTIVRWRRAPSRRARASTVLPPSR